MLRSPGAERTEPAESAGAVRSGSPPPEIVVIPVRHPGRWLAVAVLAVLAAMLVNSVVTNQNWQWDYVGGYLTYGAILRGAVLTVQVTALSMVIGVSLGVLLAVMRISVNPVFSTSSWLYTWFFRGTPVLVQLLFWYSFAYLFSDLSIGVPFGPTFHTWDTNSIITPLTAGILGLGLNEAAYMAEIVRAGLQSVDRDQHDAAKALGMGPVLALRRVILPQAMRTIVPPTGNEAVSMLKTTSLVAAIGIQEMTGTAQLIYGSNNLQIPLLVVTSIWYLAMTSVLSVGQHFLEKRFSRGSDIVAHRPVSRLLSRMRAERAGR
jgi:polar amino acid transport system permease protein